jgi:hypothetical protein
MQMRCQHLTRMADSIVNAFSKGTWNVGSDENIPKDASSYSKNWLTRDGSIVLSYGKLLIGAQGAIGKVYSEHFGYKVDGTKVHYRKINTKIQYLSGSTWTDIITGLTSAADYTFSNYTSLSGSYTYATGVDGIWKIINSHPASPVNVTSAAKNFKGYSIIDKGRMILWSRAENPTGLYGSYVDAQDSTTYTTETAEVVAAVESGTLAFKAGGATRSCFGVVITDTSSSEIFTDNYLGVLVGSAGHFGTINYATGAFTITGQAGAGTATYQWEDSNAKGVTDFSFSATRLAGEGFRVPQDVGGDPIISVLVGLDGAYYSIKQQSAYRLEILASDLTITNEVYRRELGMPFLRAAVSTAKGIVFLNNSNSSDPKLTILKKNEIGTEVEPYPLFPQFDFGKYDYNECNIYTHDRYVIIACKEKGSPINNKIILCDLTTETVDETEFHARSFAQDGDNLYAGSALTESTYLMYDGFDDDGLSISNEWISKGEQYEAIGIAESLKKVKKLRIKGLIDPDQALQVYVSYDDAGYSLIGTILGSGTYTDFNTPQSIGGNMVGTVQMGGADLSLAYPFYAEIKLKSPKFRKRNVKFVASAIGYVSIESLMDWSISIYERRMPKRFRTKQNTNLSGTAVDI